MRQKIVAGNWKMNGSRTMAASFIKALQARTFSAQVVICPPAILLPLFETLLAGSAIAYGAQNMNEHKEGAYTGELSTAMLCEAGCRYVIIGHSERRTLFGETSEVVSKKCGAALAAGLIPIVCVGETLAEREAGRTESVVSAQLEAVIAIVGIAAMTKTVIAYEPVWAIGTGKTATPNEAQAVHAFIRAQLALHDENVARRVQILYGGSLKSDNARALFSEPDIDGGLIGGASLKAEEFIAISESV